MKYLYFTYHTNDAVYLIVTYDRCNFQDQNPSYKKITHDRDLNFGIARQKDRETDLVQF